MAFGGACPHADPLEIALPSVSLVAAGVAMYLRDFLAVALALCAMVVSLQREHTFSFRKAWYHHAEEDNTVLFETTRLPPPTLCDLNGDGKLEILVATYDGKLQLLAPAPPGKQGEGEARRVRPG